MLTEVIADTWELGDIDDNEEQETQISNQTGSTLGKSECTQEIRSLNRNMCMSKATAITPGQVKQGCWLE